MKHILLALSIAVTVTSVAVAQSAKVKCAVSQVIFGLDDDGKTITVEAVPAEDLGVIYEENGVNRVRVPVERENFAWFSFPVNAKTVEMTNLGPVINEIRKETAAQTKEFYPEVLLQQVIKRQMENFAGGPGVEGLEGQWRYVRDNLVVDEGPMEEMGRLFGLYMADRGGRQLDLTPFIDFEEIKDMRFWLDISGEGGFELETIGKLKNLHLLYASNKEMKSIAPLAKLDKLVSANFGGNKIGDAAPMRGMKSLRRLRINDNEIADFRALADLPQLTLLDAGGNVLRDTASLSGLKNLEWLNLAGNRLENIDGLTSLKRLHTLNLDGCGLADLGPVASLTQLVRLQFVGNQVKSLAPLVQLTALDYLGGAQNQIEDVAPLAGHTNLKALDLSDNQIRDLAALDKLTTLELVSLARNQIESLAPLAGMRDLQALYLSQNQIVDITPLAGCQKLSSLDLSNNQIENISALAGLPKMAMVYLYQNKITDLTPLITNAEKGGIGEGTSIWLSDNPLTPEAISKQIPLLRSRYKVQVYY